MTSAVSDAGEECLHEGNPPLRNRPPDEMWVGGGNGSEADRFVSTRIE